MRIPASALVLMALAVSPAAAQSTSTRPYTLDSGSLFEYGCFDMCACPILSSSKMIGTFDLRHLRDDPLYSYYAVENVRWTADMQGHPLEITGAGTYRVGGEFAVQEQMECDLALDGGSPLHFDSGLVSGGGDFPRITIDMRRHGSPSCFDSLIRVLASPAVVGIGPPGGRGLRVTPNPFVGRTEVSFRLSQAGPVQVAIHDVAGRLVRDLAKGVWLDVGDHSIVWDGLRANGGSAPPGLYRVRIRAGEEAQDQPLVKLR